MGNVRIGLILAGREKASKSYLGRHIAKPFAAPLVLRVLGSIVCSVSDQFEILDWDENAKGEVSDRFLDSVDVCFISGLSTSFLGMKRVAKKAKDAGKIVVAGGKGVTGFFDSDPERNLPLLIETFGSVCIGRLTTKLCGKILADCLSKSVESLYQADVDEPMEHIVPRHDFARGAYLFDNVLRSSEGCSDTCPFCVVHRCLPGGCRGIWYPVPIPVIQSQIAKFQSHKRPFEIFFSNWFFDSCDSFGEDPAHTYGDGDDPKSGVLPCFKHSGMKWVTEGKVKVLKQDDWRMLTEMAKAGNAVLYYGIESLTAKFTAKQVDQTDVEELNARLSDLSIIGIGSIILDGDRNVTEDNIRWTIDWAVESGIEIQFSLCSAIDGSDLQIAALKSGQLIDINPESTCGAWPQFFRKNASPQFRIEAIIDGYRRVYSLRQITRRLKKRGFSRNAILAALAGFGANFSIRSWEKTHNYAYWLANRWEPS